MADVNRRIGLMGGAFDPIHIGHLVTAEEAFSQFDLSEVVFMPSGIPAHKEAHSLLDAEQRFEMTALAIADNPHFSISRFEVDKRTVSYTVETMETFWESTGRKDEVFFITGADAVLEILTWKDPWRISEYGNLIAATRPGYDLKLLEQIFVDNPQLAPLRSRVFSMTVPALAISSTDIRDRIKEERPIRYLVPRPVQKYIEDRGLYGTR